MSQVLSTIPNPTPVQAHVISLIHQHIGQRRPLDEASRETILTEYRRRTAEGTLTDRNKTHEVKLIAEQLGITFTHYRQPEDIASLLSFEAMGAGSQRAVEQRQGGVQ